MGATDPGSASPPVSTTPRKAAGSAHHSRAALFPRVALELEWRPALELVAGDCGADVLLDVLDDQVGPGEVVDVRGLLRAVHGVGQVTQKGDVLAILGHLAQAKRTAKDTHVSMHAGQ